MTIAKKNSDLQKIEQEDTTKKLKLEEKIKLPIRNFLRDINNDFYNEYITSGRVIDTSEYKTELAALLLGFYGIISPNFRDNIQQSFIEKLSPELKAKIASEIKFENRIISGKRSDLILNSTDREITSELANTINELIENNEDITNLKVAENTKKNLDNKVFGRAIIIAVSAVQTIAETAKQIEENVLYNNRVILDDVDLEERMRDVWVANFDERTRPAHLAASGQEKRPEDSFLVAGEYLRYPGDPNGSAGNIINCRCSKVVKII